MSGNGKDLVNAGYGASRLVNVGGPVENNYIISNFGVNNAMGVTVIVRYMHCLLNFGQPGCVQVVMMVMMVVWC